MPKYKQPLTRNPFHQWSASIGGATDIDPNTLIESLARDVKSCMEKQYGINVNANKTDITVGSFLSSKTFPNVELSFAGHTDWAHYLVSISKTAAILTIDIVQQGNPSSAMQRMNSAESKGVSSIMGALQKAVTDQNALKKQACTTERCCKQFIKWLKAELNSRLRLALFWTCLKGGSSYG